MIYNTIDNDTIKSYFNAHLSEINEAQKNGYDFSYDTNQDILTVKNGDGEVVNTINVHDARQNESLLP